MSKILVLIQTMEEFESVRPVFLGAELSVIGAAPIATIRWHDNEVVWAVTGTTEEDAVKRTEVLIDKVKPDLVLVSGTCEGLQAEVGLGDVLVCMSVTSEPADDRLDLSCPEAERLMGLAEVWEARFPRVTEMLGKPATVLSGTAVTISELPTTEEEKERLAAAGFSCIDTTGYPIANQVRKLGIPFVVARAISRVPGSGNQPTRISEAMLSVAIMVDDITNRCCVLTVKE